MIRVSTLGKVIICILLCLYAFNVFMPFLMMIFNSFKTVRDLFLYPFSFPLRPETNNFIEAWKRARLANGYKNSLIVSLSTLVSVIALTSMFAYAISKHEFCLRRLLFSYIMLGLALPARLAVVPLFLLLNSLGLTDTLFGLIILFTAINLPFSIFILKNFMDTIPNELIEAAKIDGGSPFQIYRKIILPLCKPAISIVGIVTFVNVWNDFFFPLIFINDKSKAPVTLGISIFFGEYGNEWPLLFAALTLAMMPSLVLYAFLSRQLIAGMTQGAIK